VAITLYNLEELKEVSSVQNRHKIHIIKVNVKKKKLHIKFWSNLILGVYTKNYDKTLILFHIGPQEFSLYKSQIKYHISREQFIIQETVIT